jgi:hypothetical protein
MADEGTERFDRELERLLARDGVLARDRSADPLLNLAAELRGQLAVLPAPDPEFRARLKAELLEQYTNNVRQFPGSAMPESAPPR